MFQSTPDLVNRENSYLIILVNKNFKFQSTPDLVNRENEGSSNLVRTSTVSIHSRFS